MAKLSIITVTYNNGSTIKDYLSSVLKNLPKDAEVIIVDSNSSDRTAEIVKKEKKVRLIEGKENLGFGRGSNLGVKNSKGDYLLFLNPDTKVLDDSVDKLLNFLEDRGEVGIVAPSLWESEKKPQPSVRQLPTIKGAIKQYFFGVKNAYEPYAPLDEGIIEVESVVGAAMMMRKNLFDEVNGFDERYFMYFEDLDLCRKVREVGFSIIYDPEAKFIHKVGSSINPQKQSWIRQSEKIYHGSTKFAILSLIYFLVRVKNRFLKKEK